MTSDIERPAITRFWIDPEVCLDQRKCVAEAPDLLQDRSESGGPLITSSTPRTTAERAQILTAAWVCPVAAFKIEFDDGSTHDSNGEYLKELCRNLD